MCPGRKAWKMDHRASKPHVLYVTVSLMGLECLYKSITTRINPNHVTAFRVFYNIYNTPQSVVYNKTEKSFIRMYSLNFHGPAVELEEQVNRKWKAFSRQAV
jgi:hypothetical protein